MKQKVYYFSFVILGAMIGFFIHAMVEILYIDLLLSDFDKYGFGWSWSVWDRIHIYGVLAMVLIFGLWGYNRGRHFWRVLYVDQKYSKWLGKLKQDF